MVETVGFPETYCNLEFGILEMSWHNSLLTAQCSYNQCNCSSRETGANYPEEAAEGCAPAFAYRDEIVECEDNDASRVVPGQVFDIEFEMAATREGAFRCSSIEINFNLSL